jgi:7,8-dihydropterin-6-yl-methyl-4-(beta-D-ribofuranosyl)aminobenzene 5'-phosphate synthase
MVEIRVILENSSSVDGRPGRHGLSMLVRYNGLRVLYDFGPKGSLRAYCEAAKVDLKEIDLAVLSHSHSDHGGDMPVFLGTNPSANVYLMKGLYGNLYAKVLGFMNIKVGIASKGMDASRLVILDRTTEIQKGIFIVKLSGYKSESRLNMELRIAGDGGYAQDTFEHESALVLDDLDGLVVLCSCSHHGVGCILDDVQEQFPGRGIKAFIGGLHLENPINKKHESAEYIEKEAERMVKSRALFYTGHCTGKYAFSVLKARMGDSLKKIKTGMDIEL